MMFFTKLKTMLCLVGLIAFDGVVSGQTFSDEVRSIVILADGFFLDSKFDSAKDAYLKAYDKDKGNKLLEVKIGESFRRMHDYQQASNWYTKAFAAQNVDVPPVFVYYYAQNLLATKNITQAKCWLSTYNKLVMSCKGDAGMLNGLDGREGLYKDSTLYLFGSTTLSSAAPEYSPVFYNDGVVYVSTSGYNKRFDLYFAPMQDHATFGEPVPFNNAINSKHHDGPGCFVGTQQRFVFTRNTTSRKLFAPGKDKLRLFDAQAPNGFSTDAVVSPLVITGFKHNAAQPTMSSNGQLIIFSSDAPGGRGGLDLYISRFKNGKWESPTNLGTKINSPGDEMFPYLYNDSILYFSSTGHGGLGGLDLFKVNMRDSQKQVQNLGYPINSNRDDFGLALNADGKSGYVSSNRDGGLGADDIYWFERIELDDSEPLVSLVHTPIQIDEEFPDPKPQSEMSDSLFGNYDFTEQEAGLDPLQAELEFARSQESVSIQETEYYPEPNENTAPIVPQPAAEKPKDDYKPKTLYINNSEIPTPVEQDKVTVAAYNRMTREQMVFGISKIYFELKSIKLTKASEIRLAHWAEVLKENPLLEIQLSGYTCSLGNNEYNKRLSLARAMSAKGYLVKKHAIPTYRVIAKGYGEHPESLNCPGGDCPEDNGSFRRVELKITKDPEYESELGN